MLKRFFVVLLSIFSIFPVLVSASDSPSSRIGEDYYDNLRDAIANAKSTDTIVLISDINLDSGLSIDKVVNINLSGNTISAPTQVFKVEGGTLNLSGKGVIRETQPNYGAIMLKGSVDSADTEYSVVNVGKDVTLEGWSGIFINHSSSKSYGVLANVSGTINAVEDPSGGKGAGIYVNGNIKDETNHPVINIADGAKINSDGVGLFIAGYSTFNIGDATIVGESSGIGIKSGALNIDGATITASGKNTTPTEGSTNGINASGAAIQIESNASYAGNIDINIKDGLIKSNQSHVIYEYIGNGNSTKVHSILISGGSFQSDASLNVFALSDSFKKNNKEFIMGGTYSSDPSPYLKSGYTASLDDNNLYNVTISAMKEINIGSFRIAANGNSFIKGVLIVVVLLITTLITYKNRLKILNFIKKFNNKLTRM